jgi:transcription elongation factor Elf1
MTNTARACKATDTDLKKEITESKETMFERYLECPACGHEPFPGCDGILPGQIVPIPVDYFCPHCHAITLIIAVRVKKEYLPLFEAADDNGKQGDIQNRIDAAERREEEQEMTALQRFKSIIDPLRMYQKIQRIATIRRKRGRPKRVATIRLA